MRKLRLIPVLPVLFAVFFLYFSNELRGQNACACCEAEYRQFDFWLGTWHVYTGDTLAGINRITLEQDSCVLKEEWKSERSRYTGTSYNFYDKRTRQWRQIWVDNQGGHLDLRGGYSDGIMMLESQPAVSPEGESGWHRIKWRLMEDGESVEQHWTQTRDGGKTWTTLFRGRYVKSSVLED